jgi:hypothetical protein
VTRESRLRALLDRIATWLEAHATPKGATPASQVDLDRLAATLRLRGLAPEVVTLLTFERPLAVFEYSRI